MRPSYRNKTIDTRPELFVKPQTHIMHKVMAILEEMSFERRIPVSKLIAYAIDNELDCEVPFNYDFEIPVNPPYVEGDYMNEASRILHFLKKFAGGTGIDMILLCRREFNILDKTKVLLGIRELIERGFVDSFYPKSAKFTYPLNYRYLKVKEGFNQKSESGPLHG